MSRAQNAASQPPPVLPKIGETRCYWALLSSDLQFIYLDPVLASHLEEQAETLVGKSLLQFVHPDEQASAKQDLGSVLDSRTLHGSVTRVRFSRLSYVRRQLGHTGAGSGSAPGAQWDGAEKVSYDSDYMAVDIVINWAAEGLVLCFIHAIVDLDPKEDNDESKKGGWSNWCGTPVMTLDHFQLLFRRLLICVPQAGSGIRVFQILSNQQERQLMLSWPPDQGHGPMGRDFSRLAEKVAMGNGAPSETDAKTSCTRRFRSMQTMPGIGADVESIFIPHGSIVFACHKVNAPSRASSTPTSMQAYGQPAYTAGQQHQPPYYDGSSNGYGLPPPPLSVNPPAGPFIPASQPNSAASASYSPQRWSQPGEPSGSYTQWQGQPGQSGSQPPSSIDHQRAGTYPPQGQPWPAGGQPVYADGSYQGTPDGDSEVPPPKRRVSPGQTRESSAGKGGANGGNRPVGVIKCSSCKTTSSPEWRKGPSGKKELCNACGLRFARSRAKKEGHVQAKKRKEKGVTKRDSATPPAGYRRYEEGEGAYAPPAPASGTSASPSPVNFVHYSPSAGGEAARAMPYGADTRTPYSGSSYYTSPLATQPPVAPADSGAYEQGRASPGQIVAPASFEREREREAAPEQRRSVLSG
ncbi:hypothetical protein BD626DRAFT_567963 [Schizophyllum amplum]|uniref:GATA-type domain-containing protein n=1 Tax=Schizophyllum amplum TaxID=97359 RepID=A0A550CJZ3_9AGAR|nr:hypothetical protein BD626DRAFT_567963 [Auriculariopsis ampla]